MVDTPTEKFTEIASSAQVARNFGHYKELAQRQPVAITSHGRESLVLLSAAEYVRLKALDDRVALHPADLPDDMKAALEAAEAPEATRLCRILCSGAFRYAIGKRSSNMIANWPLTACHSRTERFHSVEVAFSAR